MTEEEGRSVTLRCIAGGVPEPSITWYYPDLDGDMNSTIETYSDGSIFMTSTLNISTIQRKDSGRYICSASNIVMDDAVVINRTYTLKVTCKYS